MASTIITTTAATAAAAAEDVAAAVAPPTRTSRRSKTKPARFRKGIEETIYGKERHDSRSQAYVPPTTSTSTTSSSSTATGAPRHARKKTMTTSSSSSTTGGSTTTAARAPAAPIKKKGAAASYSARKTIGGRGSNHGSSTHQKHHLKSDTGSVGEHNIKTDEQQQDPEEQTAVIRRRSCNIESVPFAASATSATTTAGSTTGSTSVAGLSFKKPSSLHVNVKMDDHNHGLNVLAGQAVLTPRVKDHENLAGAEDSNSSPSSTPNRRTTPRWQNKNSSHKTDDDGNNKEGMSLVAPFTDSKKAVVRKYKTSFVQEATGLEDAAKLYHNHGHSHDGVRGGGGENLLVSSGVELHGHLHQHQRDGNDDQCGDELDDVVPYYAFRSKPTYKPKADPSRLYSTIDGLHPCDVLVNNDGSGVGSDSFGTTSVAAAVQDCDHPGNTLYRHMVQDRKPWYQRAAATTTQSVKMAAKRAVAESLVGEIQKHGGRFLHAYRGAVDYGPLKNNNNAADGREDEFWYELDDVKALEVASQSLHDASIVRATAAANASDINASSSSSRHRRAQSRVALQTFYHVVGDVQHELDADDARLVAIMKQIHSQSTHDPANESAVGLADPREVASRRNSSTCDESLKKLADVVVGAIYGSGSGTTGDDPAADEEAELSRVSHNTGTLACGNLSSSATSSSVSPSPSVGSSGNNAAMEALMAVAGAGFNVPTPRSSARKKNKRKAAGHLTTPSPSTSSSRKKQKKSKLVPMVSTEKAGPTSTSVAAAAANAQEGDGYDHLFGREECTSPTSGYDDTANDAIANTTRGHSTKTPPTPVKKGHKLGGKSQGSGPNSKRPSDSEAKRLKRHPKPLTDVRSDHYAFPYKLFELVDNAPPEVCGWTNGGRGPGRAFIVRDHEAFRTDLLPVYFGHNVMRSFVRQLSYWAFDKLSDPRVTLMSAGGCMWANTYFQEGRPDLLKNIERCRVAGKRGKKAPPAKDTTKNSKSSARLSKKLAQDFAYYEA